MQEKPSMSFFTNTGTYIVEPDVIDLVQKNEEITFPEIIQRAKIRGMKTGVYPVNENSWLDMGQFNTMENMKEKLNIKD
jgi:NDP-sugar pyrophosphorylase family protein